MRLARPVRSMSALAAALAIAVAASGCSMKRFVAGQVANSIAGGGDVFTRDNDPELIRDAIPFGLKTMESLLEIVPRHRKLLLAACQGFTQYGFAFVESEADVVALTDRRAADSMKERAVRLYIRGLEYGLRGLETRHRGITERLRLDPERAVAELDKQDLPVLYWTAAAWGSAISAGRDRPELTADLGVVQAMVRRALAIDEDYEHGAIHEAMILLEALPEFMGGSASRAREHFRRAVELSEHKRPTPYVLLAGTVSVAQQDRAEFERLLHEAIAINADVLPSGRLESMIMHRRATLLLERADELFLEPAAPDGAEPLESAPAEPDTLSKEPR